MAIPDDQEDANQEFLYAVQQDDQLEDLSDDQLEDLADDQSEDLPITKGDLLEAVAWVVGSNCLIAGVSLGCNVGKMVWSK